MDASAPQPTSLDRTGGPSDSAATPTASRFLPARVAPQPAQVARILLVDDDPSIRHMARRALESPWLRGRDLVIYEAATAQEALTLLGEPRSGGPIRAALVDRVLPDLDGVRLIAKMRELDPRLEIAMVTGDACELEQSVERELDSPDLFVLEKPFTGLEVRRLTAALLSRWDLGDRQRRTIVRLGRLVRKREAEINTIRSTLQAREHEAHEVTERMVAMSRLESIGQLAAGVAHEINTPTQYVGDNVAFFETAVQSLDPVLEALLPLSMGEDVDPEQLHTALRRAVSGVPLDFLRDELPTALAHAKEGVDRVSRIVAAMKEFAHPGADEYVLVDMNHAVESAVTISRNEWKYVADVELDLSPDLEPVLGYPDDLQQTVLNLIVNAAHAITDTGTHGSIRITTRGCPDGVSIDIADTGGGIPADIRERIFEPFFTTKPTGRGTGQGLAIARAAVVDKHSGELTFDVEEGVGTTFHIRLPARRDDR